MESTHGCCSLDYPLLLRLCYILNLKLIKKELNIQVIAGNVATAEATEDLIKCGADAVKDGLTK